MRKKLLILTKSNKKRHDGQTYGKCVAGVSLDPSDNFKWFRLVADANGDSLLDSQFPYSPLDIIDVELYPCPLNNQTENCRFNIYGKVGSKTISELNNIFGEMPHSFFGNMNDYVINPRNSLTVFFAKNLHIYWLERAGKMYQKVDFDMGSNHAVGISMTDPEHYTSKEKNGTKDIPMAICVASLPSAPSFMNHYNKFIATIFPVESMFPPHRYYNTPSASTDSDILIPF